MKELAKALLKFQSIVGKAQKSKDNPFFKSKYADLEAIYDTVSEPLQECGLLVLQTLQEAAAGCVSIETQIIHAESGESKTSILVLPYAENNPQKAGSAITYGRRYSLATILGIIQTDDDGNDAVGKFYGKKKKATALVSNADYKIAIAEYERLSSQDFGDKTALDFASAVLGRNIASVTDIRADQLMQVNEQLQRRIDKNGGAK